MRLISVVMGEESTEKRTADTLAMLDYGFNMYSIDKIVDDSNSLYLAKVNLGNPEYVDIVTTKDVTILNNSNKEKRKVTYNLNIKELVAPLKVGDKVGKMSLYENNKFLYDVDLTIAYDVEKANIIKVFANNIKDILTTNINKN